MLVEVGCEEMPASWIPGLEAQLAERLAARLAEERIAARVPVRAFVGPAAAGRNGGRARRPAVRPAGDGHRPSGPRRLRCGRGSHAARRSDSRASRSVEVAALARIETPKGEYLACHRRQAGAATTRSLLGGVVAATLRDLAFPKAMRWDATLDDGRGELPFGRPIRWLLLLYASRIVPFEIGRTVGAATPGVAPVRSGDTTYGHRFFARDGKPGQPIEVRSFADYRDRLAAAFVLIDRAERRDRLSRELGVGAAANGGRLASLDQESSLLGEVPDLVEHPTVVAGTFPRDFLVLPDEVLSTTMVHHQHYFPVVDPQGQLTARFLAVTNTPGDDAARNERIARNAERVLVARLRDARFFWEADRKQRLDDRLDRLDTLVFHKRLGSYQKKAERTAKLAQHIARDVLGRPHAAEDARRAALLAKVDLATDMVGEFPELQGVMGGVYAREQGEAETIWSAIYHHYLPVGIGPNDPPLRKDLGEAAITWAAVALADKADTVAGLFRAGEKPTGSRDPLGVRRQAQGLLRVLIDLPELTGLEARLKIGQVFDLARRAHTADDWSAVYWSLDRGWQVGRSFTGIMTDARKRRPEISEQGVRDLLEEHQSEVRQFTRADGRPGYRLRTRPANFLLERLRYMLEARGFDVRNVRAVTHQPLDEIRPLDARRKLEVLPELTDTPDFRTLAVLFKRVKNIARERPAGEAPAASFEALLTEPAERALLAELEQRRTVIDRAVERGSGFRRAFAEAAKIGPAVDRFFTEIFVMADDLQLRHARLRLMKQVEQLILQLADVSEIVPEA